MKTTFVNTKEVERKWYIFDAEGKTLGRFATEIANILRGKNKPSFSPSHDNGDFVIIINAEKFALTGNKLEDKKYFRHSGYLGGLTEETAKEVLGKKPTKIVTEAITGMIPRTRMRKEILSKLKVYAGSEHPHEAQQPINLEL
jgi:large subunit ribosomal protein L13